MARKFLTPIDLTGLELQNAKVHNNATDPPSLTTSDKGRLTFNTGSNRLWVWNGSAYELKATDSDLLQGQNSAYHLNRTNHTGTQLASTVSNFDTQVHTARLDQLASATAPITIVDGTTSVHAATKGQLDTAVASLTSGQTLKGAVRAAATVNVSITSAPATVDGITPAANDVFLLTGQTTGSQNGPYTWASAGTAMVRATNWDTSAEAVLGTYWVVREGSKADTFALLTNDTPITLETTVPTFTFISASGAAYVGGNGLTLTGLTFDVGAVAGSGITVLADSIAVDPAVVGRKVTGVIPASTAGIFSVSGAVVTVNHGLANSAPRVTVRYYTSPGSGNTQGALVEVEEVASDANNVVLTLPAAPAANQYVVSVLA